MELTTLGWDPYFEHAFEPYAHDGLVPARIASENREHYLLYWQGGELVGQVSGRFAHRSADRAAFPAVGDWVAASPRPEEGRATIVAVLPRKTAFSRKAWGSVTEEQVLAANIDTALIVSSLDRNFQLRRIERYLTLAWESGAEPAIVLNKADLCPEAEARCADVEAVAMGVPIHVISATSGDGIDVLRQYLQPGRTVTLLGSSGVGKSTIINALLGADRLRVNAVRARDDKGRHTTTHREMVLFPDGGIVIDNPGMRELQLWADEEAVTDVFQEIEALAAACRFRDCQHEQEPGCAVRRALEDGTLDPARYANYLGLKRELRFLASRQDQRARQEQREQSKRIAKWTRQREKAGTLR